MSFNAKNMSFNAKNTVSQEIIRREIRDLSDPVLGDVISDGYRTSFPEEPDIANTLARQHRYFWRMILSGERRKAAEARRYLLHIAHKVAISPETIDAIDHIVLDELIDLISFRFRGSTANARLYSRLLIETSAAFTETKLAAA